MMMIDAHHLLKRLEPAIRPNGRANLASRPSIDSAGFDALLASAERGDLASGREIDLSVLQTPLQEDLPDRMASIADAAEVAGFARVLVATGDRSVVLDVPGRRLECELLHSDNETLYAVDAAVRLVDEADLKETNRAPARLNHQPPAAICEAILSTETDDNIHRPSRAAQPRR
jgi:hypothetical protein